MYAMACASDVGTCLVWGCGTASGAFMIALLIGPVIGPLLGGGLSDVSTLLWVGCWHALQWRMSLWCEFDMPVALCQH
jgi:MFS family permease